MIRVVGFVILNYIIQRLPPHKRNSDRITFYQILTFPFRKIWEEWETWRDKQITRANVTNEDIALEWYLNDLFPLGGGGIYITTASPGGVYLGLNGFSVPETAAFVYLGIDGLSGPETAAFQYVPNPGEDLITGSASFAVFVPNVLINQNDAIRGVLNNYRLGGKTFIIINY